VCGVGRDEQPAYDPNPPRLTAPQGPLEFSVAGRRQIAARAWYRGEHCNLNPAVPNMRSPDAVERYILAGWLPERPFIGPGTRIAAFGSCFAMHVSEYLNSREYTVLTKADTNAYVVRIGEGLVNSYALRQQFEWAFRGLAPTTEIWHG